MTIARDSRIGRGYIAREGDTGSVVWASSRDALAVSKGAARVSVSGRPGQLVFSFGANTYQSGNTLPQPFEIPFTFPTLFSGDAGYPPPGTFQSTTLTIGPYGYGVTVKAGLLLTTLQSAAADDYFYFNGVIYNAVGPTIAIPNGTVIAVLTAGQTLLVQVYNQSDPGTAGNGFFTVYPV